MKQLIRFVLVVLALSAFTAQAAQRMVTLEVPGMYCALCPITIKKVLQKVQGVEKVEVSYEKKEAVVTFDDAKTGVEALTRATKDAGYPSTLKGATK